MLLHAIREPVAGPAGRPAAIRVASAALAPELRAAVGESIPVEVAPTPELDAALEMMLESAPPGDEEESYFEGGARLS